MSDLMRLIPYRQLLDWAVGEYEKKGSIFGISKILKRNGKKYPIFDGAIGTVFGPAAGPNTQLAQNLVASYLAGSSWFELKTVQKMDGRELAACVPKPCIVAEDECYNCEWSTELEVGQAYEEYVKAWILIHILAVELDLGCPDAVVFNMSVGYDLDGIKTPKIQKFLDEMIEAKDNPIFKDCIQASLEAVESGLLKKVTKEDILKIPSRISNSVTESTLHGCPPQEIEAIASYLLKEKHLNTYVKCNPTLLGYEFARKALDGLGFDYIAFTDNHFLTDLQWADAVPMFERLIDLAASLNLSVGIKLTNTFPVDVKAGELPSEEMYMSGRSLYPLSIQLVSRIAAQFDGKLRISYSGGADYFSIRDLVTAGVWPVTMATTLLKPGGYQRLHQIGKLLEDIPDDEWKGVDVAKAQKLADEALVREKNRKSVKPLPSRKKEESLPLMDCFDAPCRSSCPIHQDIPAYLRAMEEGRSEDALRIILEKNALPFITGTICPHTCGDRCMRSHYEESVHIREVKLQAAKEASSAILKDVKAPLAVSGKKVAVVGGGPAGLAAASFLSRAGVPVTVFEKQDVLGGVVRLAIPLFRIPDSSIDSDIELCARYGAEFKTGCEVTDLEALRKEGYTDILLAVGAWKSGRNALQYGEALDALEFLTKVKRDDGAVDLGEKVVVIGGGNTAMDVSRAALRVKGVKQVSLVYRRTKRYMPADEEELREAVEDGVIFRELLAPVGLKDGRLECSVMKLGEPDEGGRRSPVDTGEKVLIECDSVITAVGERVDHTLLQGAGAAFDEKGRPVTDENCMSSVDGLYVIGDCRRGPATVVKGIADAMAAAAAIAGIDFGTYEKENGADDLKKCLAKKGVLCEECGHLPEVRCLGCATVCEVCTDVCPNRANLAIRVPGLEKEQILHVDGMCNECGNCAVFCPYSGRPYKDKLTLFWSEEDMEDSENTGFLVLEGTKVRLRFSGKIQEVDVSDPGCGLYEPLRLLILTVIKEYSWLI